MDTEIEKEWNRTRAKERELRDLQIEEVRLAIELKQQMYIHSANNEDRAQDLLALQKAEAGRSAERHRLYKNELERLEKHRVLAREDWDKQTLSRKCSINAFERIATALEKIAEK